MSNRAFHVKQAIHVVCWFHVKRAGVSGVVVEINAGFHRAPTERSRWAFPLTPEIGISR